MIIPVYDTPPYPFFVPPPECFYSFVLGIVLVFVSFLGVIIFYSQNHLKIRGVYIISNGKQEILCFV